MMDSPNLCQELTGLWPHELPRLSSAPDGARVLFVTNTGARFIARTKEAEERATARRSDYGLILSSDVEEDD